MPPEGYVAREESLGKVYDARLIRRVYKYARPYLKYLLLALFLAAVLSGAEVLMPYLTKIGIDDYIVIRGKILDLSQTDEAYKEKIFQSYAGKSQIIDSQRILVKEGLLDPKDRKILLESKALDTSYYYLLDLTRYSGDAQDIITKAVQANPDIFGSTENSGTYFIAVDKLTALSESLRGTIREPDWQGVARICIFYSILLIIIFGVTFGQVYLMAWLGQRIMFDIRMELFEHIERLPLEFFNSQPTGRLVTRVSNDVNVLNEMFTSILVEVFKNILKLIGIIAAMWLLAPALAVATFSLLPFVIGITWYFKRRMRDAYRLVRAKIALINATLSEHLGGIKVIQMFAKERIHTQKFEAINHECYQANMHQLIVHSMFSPFIVFLEHLGIAIILYYGGGQVLRDSITLGTLVAYLSYLSMFFGPVRDIAEKFNIMQSAMAASERIFQIMDKKPEHDDESDVIDSDLNPIRGDIEFRNVWFCYKPGEWILKDVSFSVKAGQTLALVGATGSGKSTIISILSRFYDIQEGLILIDGRDIRSYPRYFLRRQMAVVLQDVFLFAGDIRRNIRLNESGITDEDIERVSRMVYADRFVQRLSGKYDHPVQEGGTTLSQGQRQLLSFARALAFNPSVLVLDEATANIDSETEKWIQQALETMLSTRTAVVVAHRLSTIKRADKILVMHRGCIQEEGIHSELLEKRGIYYKLYQLQYQSQEARPVRIPVPDGDL